MMFKTLQHLRWTVVGLAAVVLFHIVIENSAAEKWEVISQLPTERSAFSTAVVDGKIYLIGGARFEIGNGPIGLSTVEVYDPENNSWKRVADMPTPRASARAAVVDGKIYVVGGFFAIDRLRVNTKILKIVEVYDPQADTWERKQDMSQPRFLFGIGVVKRKIYVIGGANFFENPWRLDHVEVYDPDTNSWRKRANLSMRRDGFETVVVDGSIYVIGGRGWPIVNQSGPILTAIEVYEPRINRWSKKSDLPNHRHGFSTVVVGGNVYLIGGLEGAAFEKHMRKVAVYNPRNERWKSSIPMLTDNVPFGAAAVDGKIYVLGSERKNGELSLDIEVFNTGFRAVNAIGKLSTRWGELKAHRQNQP
ncbi:MAG: hypothetical protein OXI24_15930 [Candidatus Poribacteria bacterium]|nr:hypothetical protein [Candidatus Poribacteria bacterium]